VGWFAVPCYYSMTDALFGEIYFSPWRYCTRARLVTKIIGKLAEAFFH